MLKMTSRRFSAGVGFILLIGCMVGIGVVIFGFGPSSYTFSAHGPEESFTEWHAKVQEDYSRAKAVGTSEPSVHRMNELELAEELERLFAKGLSTSTVNPLKTKTQHANLSGPKLVISESIKTTKGPLEGQILINKYTTNKPTSKSTEISETLFTTLTSTLNLPKLQLRGSVVPTASLAPMVPPIPSASNIISATDLGKGENDNESYEEESDWQDGQIPDNAFYRDAYRPEMYEEDGGAMLELSDLLSLATNLYTVGTNSSGIQSFLRVINETLNQGNNSGILSQLNELYSRPEITLALGPETPFVGRNSYETSLTAFVFMSFGVFLLNQIHSLMSKEAVHNNNGVEGRQFQTNNFDASSLNMLFEPPFNNMTLENETESGRSIGNEDSDASSPNYVNNMFRGVLNLVNAYTKNSQTLECIWSLYCDELDATSAKDGLYGLAARINSVGLRLIMHQIPTELTLDVMLRALLGWDGLPCKKMFSTCDVDKAAAALKAAGTSHDHFI